MTLILGIDPGLANLGWCVLDSEPRRPVVLGMGVVSTDAGIVQPRVVEIVDELVRWPFSLMVIEEQERAWQAAQHAGKTSSKATLARVGEGAVRAVAAIRRARVTELGPQSMRARLGLPAGADKAEVAARLRLSIDGLRKVAHHGTDAAAYAYIGALDERVRQARRPT